MTYPSGTGVINNQWGPALPTASGSTGPVYAPTATPPATGTLSVPQSPSGSVTGQASTWEYANGELAAQKATDNLVQPGPSQGPAYQTRTALIAAGCVSNPTNLG